MSVQFERVALIGIGLIGSSLAHVMRREKIAGHIAGYAKSEATRDAAVQLGLVDSIHSTAASAVRDSDLVILCVPVGACAAIAKEIGAALKAGCIVTPWCAMWRRIFRRGFISYPATPSPAPSNQVPPPASPTCS
jgi:cyclohexadieny/prephenate dehydrogenase